MFYTDNHYVHYLLWWLLYVTWHDWSLSIFIFIYLYHLSIQILSISICFYPSICIIYLYLSCLYLSVSILSISSVSIVSVQVNGIPYRMCRSSIRPVIQQDLYASCIVTIVTSTLKIQAIRRQQDSRMWYLLVIISHSLVSRGNLQVLSIYASFTASWCEYMTSFLIHDSFRLQRVQPRWGQ